MTTLKDQLTGIDLTGIEREANQTATILERKFASNGCGAEFLLVDFQSANNHPFEVKGVTVLVLDEGFAHIDKSYVKLF